MNTSIDPTHPPEKGLLWKRVIILLGFALVIRLALLLALFKVTHGKEFADDFNAYRIFLAHPLVLFKGDGLADSPDVVVYSPLIPIQVWFPGKLVCAQVGEFLGHRLCMIMYDGIAVAVTAWAMVRAGPVAWRRRHWLAGLLLMCVPGSVGAAVLFGQEDSIAAMWTSFAMVALVFGHPSISALFGGIGLFTHKLFALLLSWGIFISSPPRSRWKIATTTGTIVLVFFIFLYVRFHFTGMMLASYSYSAMSNSPSPWALINRFSSTQFTFEQFKPYIMLTTVISLLLVSLPLRRGKTIIEASVVATHSTFFVVFIGIQPEHHQWFMPFMIFFAWRRFLLGDTFTMLLAWSFSGFAYAFKIFGGLAGRAGSSVEGKAIFRQWFGNSAGPIFSNLQLAFHLLTMLVGLLVIYRAVMSREPVHDKPLEATA